jgi:hypothetical protein
MADTLTPPGRARITRCGGCRGTGQCGCPGEAVCCDCKGDGRELWRACPRCGDIAWDKHSDGIYECRISCGYIWTEDHPGWQIQVLPDT